MDGRRKILNEKEKVTFVFEIEQENLQGFLTLFNSITELSRNLSVKIKNADNIRQARLDAHRKVVERQHEQIKVTIRATYLRHLESLKDIRKVFKITRTEFILYAWLVREIRKEFKAKRELEIYRMHNTGIPSKNIAEKLYMDAGAVRKVSGAWKYHRTNPLT